MLVVTPLRDTDLIGSLIGETVGRISAVAHRARGSTTRYLGGFEPFDHLQLSLDRTQRTEIYTIREVIQRETFRNLRTDLDRFVLASLVAELTLRFVPEGDPEALTVFPLVLKTIRAIDRAGDPALGSSLTCYFALRLFQLQGVDLLAHEFAQHLPDQLRVWAQRMSEEDQPILPHDRALPPELLHLICRYSAGPLGTPLNSERSLR